MCAMQEFVDLCCRAYNILRHNSHVLFSLMGLLIHSGIPGLNVSGPDLCCACVPLCCQGDVSAAYVRGVLRMNLSDEEATSAFTKAWPATLHGPLTRADD